MNKRFVAAVAIAGILVGATIGAYGTLRFGTSFVVTAEFERALIDATQSLRTLEQLRKGDGEGAAEWQEQLLDSALLSLWGLLRDDPSLRSAEVARVLARARAYRVQYPHTTNSAEVSRALSDVLSMPNAPEAK